MEQFRLVTPDEIGSEAIAAYFNDLSHEEAEAHGRLNLKRFSPNGESYDIDAWLKEVEKARTTPNTDEGVPTETRFLLMEYTMNYGPRNILPNKEIVGMVNIRLELNYNLFNSDGHVALSLAQGRRRLQVEEVALYLALNLLRNRDIEVALITPEISGVGEEACQDLGAKLLHQHFDDARERELQRYVILTDAEDYDGTFGKIVSEYPE